MRVFVTGATGFVGSAVVQELIGAGHSVLGLTRSDAGAATLAAAGVEVHRGSLDDVESLRSGAAAADGVIHTAFDHDFSKFAESCEKDRRAIEAMGAALAGSQKPLIVTSGVALLTPGRMATENDAPPSNSPSYPRASEAATALAARRGVNTAIVRLPPSVHGIGEHGFVPILIGIARDKRASAYPDTGNQWSAVHVRDAAKVFRLALEKGVPGACYHAVAEESVLFKDIAEVIGRHLDVPVVGKSPEQAAEHFDWFALFAGMEAAASSDKTRAALGWTPTQLGVIADIDQPEYYEH